MSKPVKEYQLGQIKAAVFEGDYQGKKTYSVKFQKSYKKGDQWTNTDFFTLVDLRTLAILVNTMVSKQVKEKGSNGVREEIIDPATARGRETIQKTLDTPPDSNVDTEIPF